MSTSTASSSVIPVVSEYVPARISADLPVPRISRLPTNPPHGITPSPARSSTTRSAVAPSSTVNDTSCAGPVGGPSAPSVVAARHDQRSGEAGEHEEEDQQRDPPRTVAMLVAVRTARRRHRVPRIPGTRCGGVIAAHRAMHRGSTRPRSRRPPAGVGARRRPRLGAQRSASTVVRRSSCRTIGTTTASRNASAKASACSARGPDAPDIDRGCPHDHRRRVELVDQRCDGLQLAGRLTGPDRAERHGHASVGIGDRDTDARVAQIEPERPAGGRRAAGTEGSVV